MSLNIIEMSDVIHYIDSIKDKKMHDLLHKMQFEYGQYTDIGSVEDCKNYKMLCDIPISKVNTLLQVTSQTLRDEIDALKKEIKILSQNQKKNRRKS